MVSFQPLSSKATAPASTKGRTSSQQRGRTTGMMICRPSMSPPAGAAAPARSGSAGWLSLHCNRARRAAKWEKAPVTEPAMARHQARAKQVFTGSSSARQASTRRWVHSAKSPRSAIAPGAGRPPRSAAASACAGGGRGFVGEGAKLGVARSDSVEEVRRSIAGRRGVAAFCGDATSAAASLLSVRAGVLDRAPSTRPVWSSSGSGGTGACLARRAKPRPSSGGGCIQAFGSRVRSTVARSDVSKAPLGPLRQQM
mmetsp:Transcript_66895/g.186981  ORF Transcript_66895/g.186981 Transcript_66895/m.186981 type:complete len:255 (+) Transcript_66895:446-1210(+)